MGDTGVTKRAIPISPVTFARFWQQSSQAVWKNLLPSIPNIRDHCKARSPTRKAAGQFHTQDRTPGFSLVPQEDLADTPQMGIFNAAFASWSVPQTRDGHCSPYGVSVNGYRASSEHCLAAAKQLVPKS